MNAPPKSAAAERRSRLREYQARLLERMQEARTSTGSRVRQLGVQIAGARYLLDLAQSGEIVASLPVTRVPLTQPWYLGLANIRGNLAGIIDLARYLEVGETTAGAASRVITFAPALGFNCALLVERVYGLRDAAAMDRQGDRLVDPESNAWTPLDLAALVQEPRFLQVGL